MAGKRPILAGEPALVEKKGQGQNRPQGPQDETLASPFCHVEPQSPEGETQGDEAVTKNENDMEGSEVQQNLLVKEGSEGRQGH